MSDLRVETKVRRKNNLKDIERVCALDANGALLSDLCRIIRCNQRHHDEEKVLKLRDYEAEKLGSAA